MKKLYNTLLYFIVLIAMCGCVNGQSQSIYRQMESTGAIADGEKLQEVVTNPALEEHIIHYKGMTVSFNPRLHIPN